MSSVFQKMLDFPEGKETAENSVEVDLPSGALEEILHFIYSGRTSEYFGKHVLEILRGADMYDLPKLKHLCETELYREVDKENVGQMLVRSDSFGLETLKIVALNFAANSWVEICDCEEAEIITEAGLLKMITDHLSLQRNVIRPWKVSRSAET